MKERFNTRVDKDVLNDFRAVCAKEGIHMSSVMEVFMKGYAEGKFTLVIEYDKKIAREIKQQQKNTR